VSPKKRIFPWQRNEDGFSPLDRLIHSITSSELWIRYSTPAGIALALVAVALGAYGIFALASSGNDSQPQTVLSRPDTPTPQPPTPTATAASSLPPAQVLDQPVSVEVIRNSTFVWPAAGRLSRADAKGMSIELGVDPAVKASSRGVVGEVGSNVISIDHDGGMSTRYFNLAGVSASTGQRVEKGQVIGWGTSAGPGSIGPVRFEMRSGNQLLDPRLYLPSTHADPATAKSDVATCPSAAIVVDPASSVNLLLTSDELRQYKLLRVVVTPKAPDAPAIAARARGDLGVTMDVEPAKAVKSQAQEYSLDFTFSSTSGSSNRTATCQLSLVTASSIPADGLDTSVATPTEEVAVPPPPLAQANTPTPSPVSTRTPTPAVTGTRTPVSRTSTPARTATP